MTRQVINTSLAPDCLIGQVMGDLRIKGWNLPQVAVDADPDALGLREEEDTLYLDCQGDLEIRLPHGAALKIEAVHGDAQIKLLDEQIEIGQVHGSLNLRNVAGMIIGTLHGDLSARGVTGDLEIQQALGDVDVRQVEGACNLHEVLGDLELQNIRGNLHAAAKGDARVKFGAVQGENYTIHANGDVSIGLPPEAGLRMRLVSAAHSIKVRLPQHNQTHHQGQVDLEVGDGKVGLAIEAGGEISLSTEASSWEGSTPNMIDFNEQITRQVESQIGQQMEEVTRRIQEQMDHLSETLNRSGMSPDEAQRVVEQAMRASERETARAQEKMRRAQEKLERKLEDAQRRAEQKARAEERSPWARPRHTWGRGVSTPTPPSPPAAASGPVSEEERLMILRMLEQKKISLEEADRLLSALEGGDEWQK